MKAIIVALLGIILLSITLTGALAADHGQCQICQQPAATCPCANNPVITVTGCVRDLKVPSCGCQQEQVRFTLVNDNMTTKVRLAPPQVLSAAGVSLANGDTVTVTGWLKKEHGKNVITARDITVNGKTTILRNADGTLTWHD